MDQRLQLCPTLSHPQGGHLAELGKTWSATTRAIEKMLTARASEDDSAVAVMGLIEPGLKVKRDSRYLKSYHGTLV